MRKINVKTFVLAPVLHYGVFGVCVCLCVCMCVCMSVECERMTDSPALASHHGSRPVLRPLRPERHSFKGFTNYSTLSPRYVRSFHV